ncbi:hypothetical protein [Bradyrhizobium sp. SZCCHNRI1003]|uniref:hypothetical protein n=1 Tax=Bradyrhizobium sp. SZCCHNRI1003 TaxID=3057275 RepID=UPI002916C68F|nr:hypothetical protein [Bradyrhizobium sp. SZCCHNRI1003]
MRNATVAALAYEFLFEVYRKMDLDRAQGWIQSLPDEDGLLREAFDHGQLSCWEWPAGTLQEIGILKALQPRPLVFGPYFYPVMTLEECAATDFSKFETFDNYCIAMFSFEMLHSHFEHRGEVNLSIRSSCFLEAVAHRDDIFLIEDNGLVRFDKPRYDEKVMARWNGGLDDRRIHPKGGADA